MLEILKNEEKYSNTVKLESYENCYIYKGSSYRIISRRYYDYLEPIHSIYKYNPPYVDHGLNQIIEADRNNSIITMNEECFAYMDYITCGYYHFICEYIPALILALNKNINCIVLMPYFSKETSYVNEILNMFVLKYNVKIHYFNELTDIIFCKKMIYPVIPLTMMFNEKLIVSTRNIILNLFDIKINNNPSDKLYISRQKAKYRQLTNNNEAEQIIYNNGYKETILEDLPFYKQLKVISNAKAMIGVHGAGLTNAMFMNPNSTLIELVPHEKYKHFERIAYLFSIKYKSIKVSFDEKIGDHESPVEVDVNALKNILSK